jgi:hypothetical protein
VIIDAYVQDLMAALIASPIVESHQVAFERRSPTAGYLRGDVRLLDGSSLHFREYVNTASGVERFTYVYHYRRADGAFVFRYDNTPHFRDLPGYPHHKHEGEEGRVVSSRPLDLAAVLKEIEERINV